LATSVNVRYAHGADWRSSRLISKWVAISEMVRVECVSFLNHSAGRFSDSCRQPADASGSCLRHHEALGKAAVHVTTWRARA